MVAFRLFPFYAILVVGLSAFPVRAGTVYSVYQGGAGGTLEYQFSTAVPITDANAHAQFVGSFLTAVFTDLPFNGLETQLHHPIDALELGAVVGVVADTMYFKAISSLILKFADGAVPGTAGTYALVPGAVGPGAGIPIPINSYSLRGATSFGNPIDQEVQNGTIVFLDTIIITQTDSVMAVPEPTSMILAIGSILSVVVGLRSRRLVVARVACHASSTPEN